MDGGGDLERLTGYTYLTVPDRGTYLAIMRVFTSTLLADLSAHDVAERLPAEFRSRDPPSRPGGIWSSHPR